ncbi:MAG: nicotinate-nucleotide adenylyltransferase [Gemmatimonadota bacterium]
MRLGILGGTFDPLHSGHLIIADDAAAALSLDRVLFIPAGVHPFKTSEVEAPASLRLRMVEESISESGSELFAVDDRELRRSGPSYTVDTVAELREANPEAELFLLVGSDILAEIHEWYRAEELVDRVTLAALARADVVVDPDWAAGFDRIRYVPVTQVEISSTDIRARVREGRPFRYLVPAPVYRIIVEHSLYKGRN